MNDFTIFTDSSCDISPMILEKWGVKYVSLTFHFDDSENEYKNSDYPIDAFYNDMLAGRSVKTSGTSLGAFRDAYIPELEKGNDILYIGFSSGLSTTFNSGRLAAEDLKIEYPDRTIITVDSLSASAGLGLLLKLSCEMRENGSNIQECAQFAENTKLNICHWFTVDDLKYLHRGGRISATTALVGTILGIKPIMHMDNEGHLVGVSKARGRKASLRALADKYGELASNVTDGRVMISHGGCRDEAEDLANMLRDRYCADVVLTTFVGPVIGAHSGPGTVALFFVGKER